MLNLIKTNKIPEIPFEAKTADFFGEGALCNALTVRQPYALMLVNGTKKFEYRSWELPWQLCDVEKSIPVFIHAGKQVKKERVDVEENEYCKYLAEAREQELFGCIIGAVFFGKPLKLAHGYAWPVDLSLKFDYPARDIKGWLKIWQFWMRKETTL